MNIAIVGKGAMGKVLEGLTNKRPNMVCVGAIEPMDGQSLRGITNKIDVVIDFSNPANLNMIEEFVRCEKCGVVIATTGFDENQRRQIEELSEQVPVVFSSNFSMGIAIMARILKENVHFFKDNFDIEVIEKHHNKKLDAPSGTAKALVEAMDSEGEFERVYGREGNGKREKEIGIHAVRGGTITGEHTVIFAGEDEVFEVKHTAYSKNIFAAGALTAAEFIWEKSVNGVKSGLYTMDDVLEHRCTK